MLKARAATNKRLVASRRALALAGGGPLGAIYEIGALLAIADALDGVDLNDLDIYVGVSSGSFLAASLANGLGPAELYEIFIENVSIEHPVTPDVFLQPALREYWNRALSVPQIFLSALWDYARNPFERSLLTSLQSLGQAIPVGIYDTATVEDFLTKVFTSGDRTNDFRKLNRRLYLVATELDSGQSVVFGAKGNDQVPISRAVLASSALPGLFPPVRIRGHHYVDGALKKTLHASVALKEGANLLLCINPLVPFDASRSAKRTESRRAQLVEGGLPVVLSQTFRALIHSRMQVGMAQYDITHKNADVILFEPDPDDAELFFTNVFSYSNRHELCDHAYRLTLAEISRRREELMPILNRHGIQLRNQFLQRKRPHIKTGPSFRALTPRNLKGELGYALNGLEQWLSQQHSRGVA